MKSKFIPGAVLILAILIIAYTLPSDLQILNKISLEKSAASGTGISAKPELPDFIQKTGRVAEAYIFAGRKL